MALTAFNEDMEIISKLSTYPNDTDGLTPEELKARFDQAGKLLKAYVNGTLLKELGGTTGAANLGVDKVNGTDMGSTIQAVLDALAAQIVEATLGTIPDKSIGEAKLADLAVSTRALAQLRKADGGKSQHDGGKNSGTQPCFAVMECVKHGKIMEAGSIHGGGNGDGMGHRVASCLYL